MPLPVIQPLVDPQARRVSYLRVSLTDRCNYRCTYCLPENIEFLPRDEVLTFEEIARLARIFAGVGVKRIRLTGGEPTVRKDLTDVVAMLRDVPGIESVVMTTNGQRLPELAEPLVAAGLREVNVSLDTLDDGKFLALTRRGDLRAVLRGIDAAVAAGLKVKLNVVALKGFNDTEVAGLCRYGWAAGATPRFIEHMPMSEGMLYSPGRELSAQEIRATLERELGEPLSPARDPGMDNRGPARYWRVGGDPAREVGIISAMTEHFCDSCNRVRLTAIGDLHACLGYDDATRLRPLLRGGATDEDILDAIRAAVGLKRDGHEFQRTGGGAPRKHMISIGG